jgi:hypothetical protein
MLVKDYSKGAVDMSRLLGMRLEEQEFFGKWKLGNHLRFPQGTPFAPGASQQGYTHNLKATSLEQASESEKRLLVSYLHASPNGPTSLVSSSLPPYPVFKQRLSCLSQHPLVSTMQEGIELPFCV